MSYTPTFLIKKEEFDKNYPKISGIISNYQSRLSSFNNSIEELKNKEYSRLCKNANELGISYNSKEIKEKSTKIVEGSEEYKKLCNNFDNKDEPISDILEYYDEKDFYEIEGNKYYDFKSEFSSQSSELKDFLDKNKIPYDTSE